MQKKIQKKLARLGARVPDNLKERVAATAARTQC